MLPANRTKYRGICTMLATNIAVPIYKCLF